MNVTEVKRIRAELAAAITATRTARGSLPDPDGEPGETGWTPNEQKRRLAAIKSNASRLDYLRDCHDELGRLLVAIQPPQLSRDPQLAVWDTVVADLSSRLEVAQRGRDRASAQRWERALYAVVWSHCRACSHTWSDAGEELCPACSSSRVSFPQPWESGAGFGRAMTIDLQEAIQRAGGDPQRLTARGALVTQQLQREAQREQSRQKLLARAPQVVARAQAAIRTASATAA